MHGLLRHSSIIDRSFDQKDGDINAINSILANVTGGIYQLTQVDLVIFRSNESDEVCPGHFDKAENVNLIFSIRYLVVKWGFYLFHIKPLLAVPRALYPNGPAGRRGRLF